VWNKTINHERQVVEHTFQRIKTFNALEHKWRHEIVLQVAVFKLICNLVNMDLYFHPIKDKI
jgi:SUMO ligase MMS21 Smc5/6 complex component